MLKRICSKDLNISVGVNDFFQTKVYGIFCLFYVSLNILGFSIVCLFYFNVNSIVCSLCVLLCSALEIIKQS